MYIRRAKKMSKQSDIRKHLFDGFLKFTYTTIRLCVKCYTRFVASHIPHAQNAYPPLIITCI